MANEVLNGGNHVTTKPPPEPSPLRKAKFFQVECVVLDLIHFDEYCPVSGKFVFSRALVESVIVVSVSVSVDI